ncbi:MAG: D-sedoheptulose 7-phosphate isomerase [Candidatus Marinimicrobia bacterium]|nr:D-sedoheptulose 7-phosphate isomerase [Candidatus Neomarinimicrobiota bacterium]
MKSQLKASSRVKKTMVQECVDDIFAAALKMTKVFQKGGRVFFCGNGGSAADSQHLAAELLVRLNFDRAALPALALTTDTSILTATSNDTAFEKIFVRQLEALAKEGDLLLGISTSGNSANVLEAIKYCNKKGITTLGMTGKAGGEIAKIAELVLQVPSNNVQRIQEGHITIGHILCDIIEKNLFAN